MYGEKIVNSHDFIPMYNGSVGDTNASEANVSWEKPVSHRGLYNCMPTTTSISSNRLSVGLLTSRQLLHTLSTWF